jgi:hypothetical protein
MLAVLKYFISIGPFSANNATGRDESGTAVRLMSFISMTVRWGGGDFFPMLYVVMVSAIPRWFFCVTSFFFGGRHFWSLGSFGNAVGERCFRQSEVMCVRVD